MAVSRLPSGRWRAQTYADGKMVSAAKILGLKENSFSSRPKAQDAVSAARKVLAQRTSHGVSVKDWADRWTTDPLWQRPKESTNKHNAERIGRFVEKYGALPLAGIDRKIVSEWIAGGKNRSTVPALKVMFSDAMSPEAGELLERNPFVGLKLSRSKGRAHQQPPSQEMVAKLIDAAQKHAPPSFAAWLTVAAHTGMRPGELDALTWSSVDFEGARIFVAEQYNGKVGGFTSPKNGLTRDAPLTPPARAALLTVRGMSSRWCFPSNRGGHWTQSSRSYHWNAVRAAVGYTDSLYLATRHYAAWYMRNVLDLPAEDVAIALGHTDGGDLIRKLYGHREKALVLDRVVKAYERQGNVVSLADFKNKETG